MTKPGHSTQPLFTKGITVGTRHLLFALALSLAGSLPILADEPYGDQPAQSSLHWIPYPRPPRRPTPLPTPRGTPPTGKFAAWPSTIPRRNRRRAQIRRLLLRVIRQRQGRLSTQCRSRSTRRPDSRSGGLCVCRRTRRKWMAEGLPLTASAATSRAGRRVDNLAASSLVPRRRTGSMSTF